MRHMRFIIPRLTEQTVSRQPALAKRRHDDLLIKEIVRISQFNRHFGERDGDGESISERNRLRLAIDRLQRHRRADHERLLIDRDRFDAVMAIARHNFDFIAGRRLEAERAEVRAGVCPRVSSRRVTRAVRLLPDVHEQRVIL